ncbi:MAG: peptidoglycan bridge formation glycyltransferase FemA/FemB family protein [Chloroflexi bacterium]|nr:MAG: peptidoglycan bridge formation glycyltransferase FemA/FemB family protein [Chloroflexota bacterium]
MTAYVEEVFNKQVWNELVQTHPHGHLMQLWQWGEFKLRMDWQVHRLGLRINGRLAGGAQVLFKQFPGLPLSIGYIPKGPLLPLDDPPAADVLLSAVHQTAHKHRAVFLKIEPHLPDEDRYHRFFQQRGFLPTHQTNQPRCTLLLNLSGGEAAIQAGLRKKTRKLIHRALKEGVEITEGSAADLNDFYRVISDTTRLKGIPAHHADFFFQAWNALAPDGHLHLFLARRNGEAVSGKLVAQFGDTSMHIWGGTSPAGREVFASYLLQWESIRWAIQQGLKYCDLWGIPDEIAGMNCHQLDAFKDRTDGLWGVYLFKRGFGGEIVCYTGAYDYPYLRPIYRLGTTLFQQNRIVDRASVWLEMFRRSTETTAEGE